MCERTYMIAVVPVSINQVSELVDLDNEERKIGYQGDNKVDVFNHPCKLWL